MSHSRDFEIVGVVEDAKYQDAREQAYPTFFLPFLQMSKDPKQSLMIGSHYIGDIELHVAGKPESFNAAVRQTLAGIDPNLTVITELFGLLALILACVGLYGVAAYAVARRTSEIGIRMLWAPIARTS